MTIPKNIQASKVANVSWEKGYRSYGLWSGAKRLAVVTYSPRCLGGAGKNGYDWYLEDGRKGNESTLKKAMAACEDILFPF